ncbi:outer membrane protein transport protein [Grimontia sp. NTOU-MAR1]|uniref:outer membrane protein transport protein n=1 Tax=Grimontia sp. NTOU-MAR1 TaxID=3111011 RepID=UPI002DBC0BE1|nr:outer membrane protein transport protein [Grimontia sp. NTOU-MAR1]WRV98383.1 outer membrane protein transport protein [Grimontia sp. NTOU-MAR1]
MAVRNAKRLTLSSTAVLILSTLSVNQSHAAGYQIAFDSVAGLGRAHAGEAAIGDSAAAMGRNPAVMTLFGRAEFSGSLIYFDAEIDVSGSSDAQSSSDIIPSQFAPASYYVHPINEQLAAGFGIYANYGLGTDLKDDFLAGELGGDTELFTVNLNPALAYNISPMLSLGAGISLVYATGEVNRHYGGGASAFGKQASDKILSWDGDDWTFGWNVGALLELDQRNRFGLSYRSGVDLKLEGTFTDFSPGVAIPGGGSTTAVSNVPLPAMAEFSGFHQVSEKLAIHYSALWTQWSEYKEFSASSSDCTTNGGICFLKPEKYDDSWRWAIGATYQLDSTLKLRAGFALDEKAGATTLSIPDQEAYWYAAGMNYQLDSNWSFDVGFAYMDRSDESFTETSLFTSTHDYTAKGYLLIVGVQGNYRF